MAKRAGIRKMVKWGGLLVAALLAIVWVGSCWCAVAWQTPGTGQINVYHGRCSLRDPLWPLGVRGGGAYVLDPIRPRIEWWFAWGRLASGRYIYVPLWVPLLIVSGATASVWRADARARRLARVGTCPACGYDRRGLDVGKVCPECGAAGGG